MITEKIITSTNDDISWQLNELNAQGHLVPVKLKTIFTKLELYLNGETHSSENDEIEYDDEGNITLKVASSNNIVPGEDCPVIICGFNDLNIKGIPIIKPTNPYTYALISVYSKDNIDCTY